MTEPLDAFLTRRTGLPWAEVRRLIQHRRVQVNGIVCKHYHRQLDGSERIEVDGALINDGEDASILICHKPAGVACSHAPEDAPLIYDLVPEAWRHPDLQTVGRLDRDTTGLILLTIDGTFTQQVVAPERKRWKRYHIRYRGTLIDDAVSRVAEGLLLADEPQPCLPGRLTVLDADGGDGAATMELCEGRFHQVKRMMLTLGGLVVALHRDRIGGLDLPVDLNLGQMRTLSHDERLRVLE